MFRRSNLGRLARITAVVAALTLLPAACEGYEEARTRATGGQTATGSAEIGPTATYPVVDYLLDLETGSTTLLPRSIAGEFGEATQYALSPDGSTLAYVVPGDHGFAKEVFVSDLNGSGVRKMTPSMTQAEWPAWSPDGTRIAFGAGSNLVVQEVATGRSVWVTGVRGFLPYDLQPTFTPDGSSLLYTLGTTQQPYLRIVPVTGGRSTTLIGPGGKFPSAANGLLSPDGSLVTFLSAQNGSLSPDGSLLTFLTLRVGPVDPQRWVTNADGTDRRWISAPCYKSTPAGTWSPDGSRIVCSNGGGDIVVVDIATGAAREVAEGWNGIWLDNHTLLIDV
jgi:Tol biopolymer transport system component